MGLFSSKWEEMSHEEKVTTGTQALISAFSGAKDGGGTPTFHFESQIMKLVDASDKPYSKFLSNNSWWLNKLITRFEGEYKIKFDTGEPITSTANETPPETQSGTNFETPKAATETPESETKSSYVLIGSFLLVGMIIGVVIFLTRKKA